MNPDEDKKKNEKTEKREESSENPLALPKPSTPKLVNFSIDSAASGGNEKDSQPLSPNPEGGE